MNEAPPAALSFSAADVAAAVVMNAMWGLNLIAVKMGVDLIAPLTAASLRQFIVLIVCLPTLRIIPGKMRELIGLGLLSGAAFYIITNYSMQVSDNVATLAIAGQLSVPFALILAIAVLGERIHLLRISGIALAFGGVLMLVFDPAAADATLGVALTACASVIWAICSLIQRRLKGVPVLTIYAWVGLVGSFILIPMAILVEPHSMAALPGLPLSTFGWILFSAVGSTVLGQGAMSLLLQRHPVSTIVPLTLATPVISVVASAWWFGTHITAFMLFGGLIVMIGIAIVTIRTGQIREIEVAS